MVDPKSEAVGTFVWARLGRSRRPASAALAHPCAARLVVSESVSLPASSLQPPASSLVRGLRAAFL